MVESQVLELSREERSIQGDVDGLEVRSEVGLNLDLVGRVVGGDQIFLDVLVSSVTKGSVSLVGSVLDGVRDLRRENIIVTIW